MYIEDRRIIRYKMMSFRVLLLYSLLLPTYAISNGANEPIEWTDFGLITRDCALQYCETKDGLALWLSLSNVCSGNGANPYFMEIGEEEESTSTEIDPFIAGSICATISATSFFLGYSLSSTSKKQSRSYSLLPMDQVDIKEL